MTRSAPLSFDQSQEQVEAMMEQGTAFSDVEDVIDASELSAIRSPSRRLPPPSAWERS
jgi:hypothetical protein